jgi:hypothetical protein
VSEYRELFAEVTDLQPPDRLRQQVAAAAGRPGRQGVVRARVRRPLLIGLAAVATVAVLAGLALVAHSRSGASTAHGTTPVTRANLLRAMQAPPFTHAKLDRRPLVLPCRVLGGATTPSIYSVSAELDVRPLALPGNTARTLASLDVLRDPATAALCAKQLMQYDLLRVSRTARRLTSDIMVFPNLGGPGTLGMTQDGVVTDGAYDIWGSEGRIVYSGFATNRTDADAVAQGLRAAAQQFRP